MANFRRNAVLLGWMLVALFTPPAGAQTQAAAPPPSVGAAHIGVAAAVRGDVRISAAGAIGKIASSGVPIFLGDTVTTGPDSRLQILLLDETTFTIGPNSAITLDRFVYDPATHAGKVSARVVQGTFRFVTGKIARRKSEDMEVKLPAGVIGIRGTIAAGKTEGASSTVVLLGPGPRNNTGDPPGRITVSNTVGGATREVVLARPGFSTQIAGADSFPTPAAQLPSAELNELTTELAASAEEPEPAETEPAPESSATEQSGQATAQSLESLTQVASLTQIAQELEQESNQAAQQTAKETTTVADGTATLDNLRTIETGQFYFSFSNSSAFVQTTDGAGSPVNIAGSLSGDFNIDFGARTVGGGNSSMIADTSNYGGGIYHSETFASQSFATGAGHAAFSYTSSDNELTTTFTLKNSGGTIAKQMKVETTHEGAGGNYRGSGSIDNINRTSGTAP